MKHTTASIPTWTILPRPLKRPLSPQGEGGSRALSSSDRPTPVLDRDREVSLSPNFGPDIDFVLTSPSTVCLSSHDIDRLSEKGMPPELLPTRRSTAGVGDHRCSPVVRLRPRPKYRACGFVSPYSPICLKRQDTSRLGIGPSLWDHPSREAPPSDAAFTFTPCPPTLARCALAPPPLAPEAMIAPKTPSVVLEPFAKLSFASPETESPFAPPLLPDLLTDPE